MFDNYQHTPSAGKLVLSKGMREDFAGLLRRIVYTYLA